MTSPDQDDSPVTDPVPGANAARGAEASDATTGVAPIDLPLEPDYRTWQRQFIIVSQAWYAASALPYGHVFEEINLLLREPEPGNASVEFLLNWHDLSNSGRQPSARYRTAGVPRLEAFSEAWPALLTCQDLLRGLSDLTRGDRFPTAAEVTLLLLQLHWQDVTDRTAPR